MKVHIAVSSVVTPFVAVRDSKYFAWT
jgi:hypothetical protein